MAIDYGNEWKKLMKEHGDDGIIRYGPAIKLGTIMRNQICHTIIDREKLMEEYIKAQIKTDIIGAEGGYHRVKLEVFGESRGTIPISKNAFNTWIRNKNKRKEDTHEKG